MGAKFRELMEIEKLAAVSIFGPAGEMGTYFAEWGAVSRIDFLVMPQGLLGNAVTCRTLPKEAKKLQLIRDSKPRDHRPILAKVHIAFDFGPMHGGEHVRWS